MTSFTSSSDILSVGLIKVGGGVELFFVPIGLLEQIKVAINCINTPTQITMKPSFNQTQTNAKERSGDEKTTYINH
jgi:hypothetical protein